MKVKQLIKILKKCPQDATIFKGIRSTIDCYLDEIKFIRVDKTKNYIVISNEK